MTRRRESILLVEDDVPLRRMLSLALRLEGFLTFEAGDGFQAIALLDQFEFDAIVLDLLLPGIDGLAVAQEIRAQASTRTVPVIVMTASPTPLADIDPPASCGNRSRWRRSSMPCSGVSVSGLWTRSEPGAGRARQAPN